MSRRQVARRRRVQEFWRSRVAAAQDSAAAAAVAWDYVRAEIRRLPADERDAAYREAAGRLNGLRRELRTASTHPRPAPTPRRARARARVTAPRQERQP